MNLYLHDEKHEQIIGTASLGNLSVEQIEMVQNIIRFLDEYKITTRYKQLVLAKSVEVSWDENGEPMVQFDGLA